MEIVDCLHHRSSVSICSDVSTLEFSHVVTYLLTPWCRVPLQKLTGLNLVKTFPAFHGPRRFITAFTSVRHLSLSRASPIQSTYPHPTSWRSILILSIHLRLGLPSGLFPSGFPTKTLTPPLLTHTRHMPSPSHSSRFYHPHNIGWGVQFIHLLVFLMWLKLLRLQLPKLLKSGCSLKHNWNIIKILLCTMSN